MGRPVEMPVGGGFMSKRILAALFLAGPLMSGCATPEGSPIQYQRQQLPNVSYQVVFEAAERAVGERFGVAKRDAAAGLLESRPQEGTVDGSGTRIISDKFGTPRQGRRVTEVRVVRDGPNVEVLCRVQVQELETEPFRVMQRERGVYDRPSDTPADSEAGTTPEQNAVWVTRRRDREMERQILESVAEWVDRLQGEEAKSKVGAGS